MTALSGFARGKINHAGGIALWRWHAASAASSAAFSNKVPSHSYDSATGLHLQIVW
jgi:hypothetical protein